MDKISRDDISKMMLEWNKLSMTQSVTSSQPQFTWTNTNDGTTVPTFFYNFKQYDEMDVIIFLYNRLVDEINDIKNK